MITLTDEQVRILDDLMHELAPIEDMPADSIAHTIEFLLARADFFREAAEAEDGDEEPNYERMDALTGAANECERAVDALQALDTCSGLPRAIRRAMDALRSVGATTCP